MRRRKFTNLVDYLEKRLGTYKEQGEECLFFCPFCIDRLGDESDHRNLTVNTRTGKAYCYRCKFGARKLEDLFRGLNRGALLIEELSVLKGLWTPPPKNIAAAVREIVRAEGAVEARLPVLLPQECLTLVGQSWPPPAILRRPMRYLRETRRVSQRVIDKFRIGYCAGGRYTGYLVFPVQQGGEHVYFTTRFCGRSVRKTWNPPNKEGYYRRSLCLLNYDNVIGAKVVFIVEGPLDCMAYKNAVALLGRGISEAQIQLLEALAEAGTREFVISLDADAGRPIDRLYGALAGRFPKLTVLLLGEGDPDERRGDLKELVRRRGLLAVTDRVRLRLSGGAKKTLDGKRAEHYGTARNGRKRRG